MSLYISIKLKEKKKQKTTPWKAFLGSTLCTPGLCQILLFQAPKPTVHHSKGKCVEHSVVSDSLQPHGLYSPWNSLALKTGVGSLSLLQGIFPTQGSNPGLPHCRQILYQLSHKTSLHCAKQSISKSVSLEGRGCMWLTGHHSPMAWHTGSTQLLRPQNQLRGPCHWQLQCVAKPFIIFFLNHLFLCT